MPHLTRSISCKLWDKIPVSLAARLLGVTDTTIYRWLKNKELLGLTPEDIRYMIIKASKKRKRKPRGRPFEGKDDPRRYDLSNCKK